MEPMDTTFNRYEASDDEKVLVKDRVLFGDKEDVKVKHAYDKAEGACGGTILFTLRRSTRALPGNYCHGKVYVGDDEDWIHVVHHESIDGTKLGKLLCSVQGYSDFRKDNVWSRYDWCHYRNWGTKDSSDEDENSFDDDDESYEEKEADNNIYFYPVDGQGKFTLDPSCILGDWHYGARLCDPKTGLAYAYVFGDVLIHAEDYGNKNPETDFNVDPTELMA